MIKCTKCGREFKSPQALGGHMRGSHQEETPPGTGASNTPGNTKDASKTAAVIETAGEKVTLVTEEPSQAEQIRNYIKQGYTVKQMTSQFGFSETTIRQEIAKLVRPEGEPIEEKAKLQDGAWPVIRKMGGGVEAIAPEAVLRQYMGGTPQEEIELRAIMKFRAAMLMVMDMVNIQKGNAEADAKRMMPILSLMKETREEQDAAAQRARESNSEIADRAAYETATQLSQVITENNARITNSINEIKQAMGGKEESPLGQFLNSIQSMQQMMGMFGISLPGMPGQAPGAPAEHWQPPPITRRNRNESQGGKDARPNAEDDGHPAST